MKSYKTWAARKREDLIQSWPEWAPAALCDLTREELRQYLESADSIEGMPDAELTPEIAAMRGMARAFDNQAREFLRKLGRTLLDLRARSRSEAEFWEWSERACPREDAELAMQLATEEAR